LSRPPLIVEKSSARCGSAMITRRGDELKAAK
jgi:hypothetical protein